MNENAKAKHTNKKLLFTNRNLYIPKIENAKTKYYRQGYLTHQAIGKRLRSCSAVFDLMYLIFDLIYLIFYLIYLIFENTIDLILNAAGKINKRLKN